MTFLLPFGSFAFAKMLKAGVDVKTAFYSLLGVSREFVDKIREGAEFIYTFYSLLGVSQNIVRVQNRALTAEAFYSLLGVSPSLIF